MTGCHDPAPGLTGSHYPACHRFFRRSSCTVLAWVWGLFSVKHCTLTSNTNTQQSEFGSVDDSAEGFSSMLNATDITESLASPSACSQRLRLALSNQWVEPRTHTCTYTEKRPDIHSFGGNRTTQTSVHQRIFSSQGTLQKLPRQDGK